MHTTKRPSFRPRAFSEPLLKPWTSVASFIKEKSASIPAIPLLRSRSAPNGVRLELHSACSSGDIGSVKFALDNGQSVHSAQQGLLPLHIAAAVGCTPIVRYLLERGACVNALRQAKHCNADHLPDVHQTTSRRSVHSLKGQTALHFAAANGHLEVVILLLEHGGWVGIRDEFGSSPIDIAAARRRRDIVDVMLRGIDVPDKQKVEEHVNVVVSQVERAAQKAASKERAALEKAERKEREKLATAALKVQAREKRTPRSSTSSASTVIITREKRKLPWPASWPAAWNARRCSLGNLSFSHQHSYRVAPAAV